MKNKKQIATLLSIFSLIFLVFIDQITKHFARVCLADGPFDLIPGVFSFTYHGNTGSIWGIMQGKTTFLILVSVIALVALVIFLYKMPLTKRFLPLRAVALFIAGGAVGNMIDRVALGYVVDFFYFKLIDFPIFNVADIYVSVSCVLLAVLLIFFYKDQDFAFLSRTKKKE